MPEVAFDIGEMYSGLMPINRRDPSRSLFFVFQPNTHNPDDEALTIWLNGGPGCSSLEGFFQENGKFVWREGQEKPSINQYAWTNLTNMLWVEQPVGTGYTQGDITAVSEEETALDFLGFFKNFQRTFGIKEYEIYVTGESYAGRYVPYISAAMLDEDDQEYFNVKGKILGLVLGKR
jgi:carboxypeptidase D